MLGEPFGTYVHPHIHKERSREGQTDAHAFGPAMMFLVKVFVICCLCIDLLHGWLWPPEA